MQFQIKPDVFEIPIAMIPRNGKPIAVIKNPKLAIKTLEPAA